jgi:hypothetical protein
MVYFNQLFGVSAIKMRKLGVFNGNVKTDNKMFVDPKLLEDAKDEFLGAHGDITRHFSAVVELIKKVKTESPKDPYFAAAVRAMRFKETSNTGLGCSAIGKDGNGIGKVLATRIVKQAILILPHVDFQPEVLEMIGVFTEGLGCDRISDMIVALLKARFVKYTSRVTSELQIQKTVKIQFQGKTYVCPQTAKGEAPILLVPRSILKPLPVAADIEQALDNADLNEQVRKAANKMFADARERGSVTPGANEMRSFILTRPSIYREIFEGYKRAQVIPYDFDVDPRKISDYDPIAEELVGKPTLDLNGLDGWGRVERCLSETISHFKHSIEENKLSDVLYDDESKPRNELIAQRLIYSIGKIFGKLCDVDVTRESNSGPGPVDFRFSVGEKARLIVETKLSTHERLKDGYYVQLPTYGKAEEIKRLVLVIIRVSEDDKHLVTLGNAIKQKALPIEVITIDAVRKPSASKRKSSM